MWSLLLSRECWGCVCGWDTHRDAGTFLTCAVKCICSNMCQPRAPTMLLPPAVAQGTCGPKSCSQLSPGDTALPALHTECSGHSGVEGVLLYPTAKALYRWINLLMCPSPQNESSIKQFYYIVANTSSVSVIHIKKLHLIIKHTICTGHLRETG